MKRALRLATFCVLLLSTVFATSAYADEAIASHTVGVGGVKLHYLTAGHGTPLILLHGSPETPYTPVTR